MNRPMAAEASNERTARLLFSYAGAFVVGQAQLEKLVELITKFCGDCRISADIADGASIEFRNLEDLLSFPNIDTRQIHSTSFDGTSHSEKVYKSLSVTLKIDGAPPISGRVTGTEEQVTLAKINLDEIALQSQQQYSWLYRHETLFQISEFFWALIYSVTQGAILFSAASFLLKNFQFDDQAATPKIVLTSVILLGFANFLRIGLSEKLRKYRKKFFPNMAFLIGEGQRRFERVEKRRTYISNIFFIAVFLSLFVGIIAGVASTIIYQRFFGP